MGQNEILTEIIAKGGIYGKCAELYYADKEKSKCFICEISEHGQTKNMIDFFGKKLVLEIIKFAKKNT